MASSFRANADGTTSVLNGSGTEVVKFPSTASVNTTVATLGDTIGVGQTWQDVTASRALGTTYTNSTGKPIMVAVSANGANAAVTVTLMATINGTNIFIATDNNSAYTGSPAGTVIVPNGATYAFNNIANFSQTTFTNGELRKWMELR